MLRTRSIWTGVVAHGLWDAVVTINSILAGNNAPDASAPVADVSGDLLVEGIIFTVRYFEPLYALTVLIGYFLWIRANRKHER